MERMTEALEGHLGAATDAEWLAAHRALTNLVADDPDFPDDELAYVWDPELSPASLIDEDEIDYAPEADHG